MPKDNFANEIENTIRRMFHRGTLDPSAEEIAKEYFKGMTLNNEIVESIRRRLPRIKRTLVRRYGDPVYLVSETYYEEFRKEPPITKGDARKCVPGGHSTKSMGIKLNVTGEGDLILQATRWSALKSQVAKKMKSTDRVIKAVENGYLTEGFGAELLGLTIHDPYSNCTISAKGRVWHDHTLH